MMADDCVCDADPPHFVIRPRPFYQSQPQQTIVMPCSAAGEPQPTITWRRVGIFSLSLSLSLSLPISLLFSSGESNLPSTRLGVSLYLIFPAGGLYGQQAPVAWWSRLSSIPWSVAGLSRFLDRGCGTSCPKTLQRRRHCQSSGVH